MGLVALGHGQGLVSQAIRRLHPLQCGGGVEGGRLRRSELALRLGQTCAGIGPDAAATGADEVVSRLDRGSCGVGLAGQQGLGPQAGLLGGSLGDQRTLQRGVGLLECPANRQRVVGARCDGCGGPGQGLGGVAVRGGQLRAESEALRLGDVLLRLHDQRRHGGLGGGQVLRRALDRVEQGARLAE